MYQYKFVVKNQVESLAGIGVSAVRASDQSVLKDVISGKYRFGE